MCGKDARLHFWKCEECAEAGFELVPGTGRLVTHEQQGERDATFVHVSRLRWVNQLAEGAPRLYPRPKEMLLNAGRACLHQCGGKSGYCSWCGVGNACCIGRPTDPMECQGVSSFLGGRQHHECVEVPLMQPTAVPPTQPSLEEDEEETCYEKCGKAAGFCNWCGAGNVCCDSSSASVLQECVGAATAAFGRQKFQCMHPQRTVPPPGPLDFGCSITIRGSKTPANSATDADFLPTELGYANCDECTAFSGFWNLWQDIEAKVVSVLVDNGCVPGKQNSLLITGHSMGASVATLAMYTMQMRGYSVAQSYNFESTRVGDYAFAMQLGRVIPFSPPVFRITVKKDPVPHLPPRPLYHHVGTEVYFPGDDHEHIICETHEDSKCADRYDMMDVLGNNRDHCRSVLVKSGDICTCSL